MPALSTSQQRLMAMVHAYQKGELKTKPSRIIKLMARKMDPEDVKHFAETKHEGLPEHVEKKTMNNKTAAFLRGFVKQATLFDFTRDSATKPNAIPVPKTALPPANHSSDLGAATRYQMHTDPNRVHNYSGQTSPTGTTGDRFLTGWSKPNEIPRPDTYFEQPYYNQENLIRSNSRPANLDATHGGPPRNVKPLPTASPLGTLSKNPSFIDQSNPAKYTPEVGYPENTPGLLSRENPGWMNRGFNVKGYLSNPNNIKNLAVGAGLDILADKVMDQALPEAPDDGSYLGGVLHQLRNTGQSMGGGALGGAVVGGIPGAITGAIGGGIADIGQKGVEAGTQSWEIAKLLKDMYQGNNAVDAKQQAFDQAQSMHNSLP